MKYLPFVFCCVLFLVGFNVYFHEEPNYWGHVARKADGSGLFLMALGCMFAAIWAGIISHENIVTNKELYESLDDSRQDQHKILHRLNDLESRPAPRVDDEVKKHLINLEMRITELDRRVSGSDPFGG